MKKLFPTLVGLTVFFFFSVLAVHYDSNIPIRNIKNAAAAIIPQAQAPRATFTRPLSIGSKGADVVALQQVLIAKGYLNIPSGATLGYYGKITQAALAKLQKASNIPATGLFGPATMAKLEGDANSSFVSSSSAPTSYTNDTMTSGPYARDLKVGSQGSDVKSLQQFLISNGYLSLPPDKTLGYFGNLTQVAVTKWQTLNNLPASGLVAGNSRTLLNGVVNTTRLSANPQAPIAVTAPTSTSGGGNSSIIAPTTATLTVVVSVTNTGGGTATASNFTVDVSGASASPSSFSGNSGAIVTVTGGSFYVVSASTISNYTATLSTACSGTIATSSAATCTIIETYVPPVTTGTVNVVVNVSGGGASASNFTVTATGASATPSSFAGSSGGTAVTVNGGSAYTISASTVANYTAGLSSNCATSISASASVTCTITETYVAPDTTAPVLSSGAPSGSLASSTTSTTMSLTTNENATCKYSTSSGVAYGSMTNTFSTTGSTSQSTTISSLSSGNSYTYYVRCIDASSNANSSDYTISFSVAVPADTTAPTVSISAPSNSSTQSGTISITASASDNVGVVGVQFKIDGSNLSSEDTSSPYSISLDTLSVSNASHSLTAVARDAAGNTTTSSAITITVYNQTLSNVTYCTTSNLDIMDMYYPPSSFTGPLPVIVYFHSGGWTQGDKSNISFFPNQLADFNAAGYVLVAVNYRLAPTYVFPTFIQDAKCSVRFLRANATRYNLDPNHIGAFGDSAGGHIAAMVGVVPNGTYEGSGNDLDKSSRVQAVAEYYGPADFTVTGDWPSNGLGYSAVTTGFGASPGSGDPVLAAASPVTYVTSDDPPFKIYHGVNDTTVYPAQSQHLYDALTAAGVTVTLTSVANAGHAFNAPAVPSPATIAQQTTSFFDLYLK